MLKPIRTSAMEYTALSDHIADGENIRDFRQLLGEHAIHMINAAVHYGSAGQKLALLSDQERLTDLHQEWADKVTNHTDPREWKMAAKRSIRTQSRCALHMIGARAERRLDHVLQMKNRAMDQALAMAADFHVNLDPCARVSQNGDLHALWTYYGALITATVDSLTEHGSNSDAFYQRASNCIKAALALGAALDTLQIK